MKPPILQTKTAISSQPKPRPVHRKVKVLATQEASQGDATSTSNADVEPISESDSPSEALMKKAENAMDDLLGAFQSIYLFASIANSSLSFLIIRLEKKSGYVDDDEDNEDDIEVYTRKSEPKKVLKVPDTKLVVPQGKECIQI